MASAFAKDSFAPVNSTLSMAGMGDSRGNGGNCVPGTSSLSSEEDDDDINDADDTCEDEEGSNLLSSSEEAPRMPEDVLSRILR